MRGCVSPLFYWYDEWIEDHNHILRFWKRRSEKYIMNLTCYDYDYE